MMLSSDDTLAILTLIAITIVALLSIMSLIFSLRINRLFRAFLRSIRSRTIRTYLRIIEERRRRRFRNRYLVFELIPVGLGSSVSISKDELNKLLRSSFKELFGVLELGMANPTVVFFEDRSLRGIVRYRSTFRPKVILALANIQLMRGDFIVNPIRTTGTLSKAMKYLGTSRR